MGPCGQLHSEQDMTTALKLKMSIFMLLRWLMHAREDNGCLQNLVCPHTSLVWGT